MTKHKGERHRQSLLKLNSQKGVLAPIDKTIHQDLLSSLDYQPSQGISLLFLDTPFGTLSENTDYPLQKPEKLAANRLLASNRKGDIILDSCLSFGASSVVARKLGRHYVTILTLK